jgi:hypothetical protein
MTGHTRIAKIVVGAAAGLAILTGTSAVATAEASPSDELCRVDRNTWVFDRIGGDRIYTILSGHSVRVLQRPGNGYAYGHGNGHSDGWFRDDGRLWNCHITM